MKQILLSLLALCLGAASQAQSLPHLAKVGQSLSLIVDGSPMVLRAGELNNSTASSIRYMEEQRTFERLKALNLNSVIATASWELVEPVEGEYNFAEVDYIIEQARKHDMKVMLLWFGTFKNPFMTYAPSWVKQNPKKYPRAKDADGNDLEMPSVFSEAVLIGNPELPEEKMDLARKLMSRFEAVRNGVGKKYLLMNIPVSSLQKAIDRLPAMRSPTVIPLANGDWCSVQTVVDENNLWNIIEDLKGLGAEGILVLSLDKIVM